MEGGGGGGKVGIEREGGKAWDSRRRSVCASTAVFANGSVVFQTDISCSSNAITKKSEAYCSSTVFCFHSSTHLRIPADQRYQSRPRLQKPLHGVSGPSLPDRKASKSTNTANKYIHTVTGICQSRTPTFSKNFLKTIKKAHTHEHKPPRTTLCLQPLSFFLG